jgi:hypothetical protein
MARVSSGFSLTGVNTAASVLGNIKATASKPMRVYEIGLFYTVLSTNPYDIGLARMNAVGTGTITSAAGVAHETADTPVGVVETGWTTARAEHYGRLFPALHNSARSWTGYHLPIWARSFHSRFWRPLSPRN